MRHISIKWRMTLWFTVVMVTISALVLVALIPAFAPAANVVAQFSQIYDLDAKYAGLINAVTMLLCIVTMPLLIAVYQM